MLVQIQEILKKNIGVTLTVVNLLLALVLFFQSNPLGLFATGYAAADPMIEVTQADVQQIEIRDPDFNRVPGATTTTGLPAAGEVVLTLVRQEQLPRSQWSQKPDESALFDRVAPEYSWKLKIRRAGSDNSEAPEREFAADAERVADLFKQLAEARRHHYVPRTPEKDRDLQMSTDGVGRYEGLSLAFQLSDGSKLTLYVGRSSLRGNQSYLRLDDEKKIFLAETNLRSVAGPGEPDYFRNRRLVPAAINEAAVTGVHLEFSANGGLVSLNKDGGVWRVQSPPLAGKVREDQIEQIVADIVDWKAVAFPGGASAESNEAAFRELLKDYETPPQFPFVLRVEYTSAGNLTDRAELIFTVLGRKNFSNYLVRTSDGTLCEISSVFLEDLMNPREKLVDKSGSGVSPLLQ